MAASLRTCLGIFLMFVSCMATADALPDPTRPAIDLNSSVDEVAPRETLPVGLQSIIIAPHERTAIINGVTLHVGDRSGDARLIEVRESSVVLENARGRRVLELFPRVAVKPSAALPRTRGATGGPSILPESAAGGNK